MITVMLDNCVYRAINLSLFLILYTCLCPLFFHLQVPHMTPVSDGGEDSDDVVIRNPRYITGLIPPKKETIQLISTLWEITLNDNEYM